MLNLCPAGFPADLFTGLKDSKATSVKDQKLLKELPDYFVNLTRTYLVPIASTLSGILTRSLCSLSDQELKMHLIYARKGEAPLLRPRVWIT